MSESVHLTQIQESPLQGLPFSMTEQQLLVAPPPIYILRSSGKAQAIH
jgi:hypothetical protein